MTIHLAAVVAAMPVVFSAAARAQAPTELPPMTVIGVSPLIGSGIDRNTVPAETHVLDSSDLRRNGPADLI